MFDEYNDFYDESCGFDDLGMGFQDPMFSGYDGYKPMKATNRNVQDAIAMALGADPYYLDFVKLDDLPDTHNWRHSCFQSGVTNMTVNQFMFEDGSNIVYGVCPFFPQCNKVHYYVDRGY